MMSNSDFSSGRAATAFAAAFALMVLVMPARAADPVFPPGSHIGLVPPAGMVTSNLFAGFTDPDNNAAIVLTALPAAAYSQIEKALDAETLKQQGVSVEKREPMQLDVGKGILLSGRQTADKARYRKWLLVATVGGITALVTVQVREENNVYSENVVRAALATLSVRATVPEKEELGLLPFTIGDLAGFHVDNVVRGRALILTDAPSEGLGESSTETPQKNLDPHLLVAAMPGGPSEPDDRATFARLAFTEIGGIKDVHVTMSEPLRIGGQYGYQTMAEAKDARTGSNIMVVQWLRFGGSGYLQMIGIARADGWTSVLSRLRTVRDSIEPK
jgi:hypothetical protein